MPEPTSTKTEPRFQLDLSPRSREIVDSQSEEYRAGRLDRSAVVDRIILRYDMLIRRASTIVNVTFTPAELNFLRDLLNGTALDERSMWRLAMEIEDGARLDGLDAKWGVDAALIIAKVNALSGDARCALVEGVEAYWRDASRPPSPSAAAGEESAVRP
jgi:hypothetical protein